MSWIFCIFSRSKRQKYYIPVQKIICCTVSELAWEPASKKAGVAQTAPQKGKSLIRARHSCGQSWHQALSTTTLQPLPRHCLDVFTNNYKPVFIINIKY